MFKVEPAYDGLLKEVFAGTFHDEDTEVHVWSEIEGLGHFRWLQGPMNHLPRKRQLKYITDTMRYVFNFLRWY